jgi:heat shock protein HslJ
MRTLLLSLIVLGLFSCGPKIPADQAWSGKRWILTEMKEVPVQLSGTRRDAFMEFDWVTKHFTGNGGCNEISGNYALRKNDVSFGDVTSTKMSCTDLAFEDAFLDILRGIDGFEMEGQELILKDGRKEMLRFRSRT